MPLLPVLEKTEGYLKTLPDDIVATIKQQQQQQETRPPSPVAPIFDPQDSDIEFIDAPQGATAKGEEEDRPQGATWKGNIPKNILTKDALAEIRETDGEELIDFAARNFEKKIRDEI